MINLIKNIFKEKEHQKPHCFNTYPSYQYQDEYDCFHCEFKNECLKENFR
jgi:hypothetical protein